MDPIFLPSIIQGAGALGGSLASLWSANKINSDNLAFQREVAQNGIRWKVADMKAAGLNPLLSTGINATAPAGGSSVMPDFSGIGSAARDVARLVAEKTAQRASEEVSNLKKQGELLSSQLQKTEAETLRTLTEQGLISSNTSKAVAENQAFVDALRNMSPRDRRFYILRKFAPLDAQSGKGISEVKKYIDKYGEKAGSKLGEWWFNFTN